MSTVTIPRPDVTTEDVAAALRTGRGPYPGQARTACTSSPARLSARSCRMWLTT